MRFIFTALAMSMLWAAPAHAQQPSQQQIQAFGNRALSLALAIDAARRCPGWDAIERAVADKLWEVDAASLRKLVATADAQVAAIRQRFAARPCTDTEFAQARREGTNYAIAITSAEARMIAELTACEPIHYFANAKPWASARKTPAELETVVTGVTGALRPRIQNSCGRDNFADPVLSTVVRAEAALRSWAKYGFGECVPVGAFLLSDPVCAWKTPVAEGVVAGKLCDLGGGVFDRENCVFGFDRAGNLLLTYAVTSDSVSKDAIDRVGFAIGGQRYDTRDVVEGAGGRRTWRFPPDAAKALLAAPRDAELDAEGFIGDSRFHANTPHPAADWQDAVQLAKAL